jgi:maleamate amidohydrolase
MKRPWDDIISDTDAAVYRAAGFGSPIGIGRRPALLVIDVQYRTVGKSPKPILEALKEYPTSCGDAGWRAIRHITQLLKTFRDKEFPVIYPFVAPKTEHDRGRYSDKMPRAMDIPMDGYEFVTEIAPHSKDIKLPKAHASAFFGTALSSYLVGLGVDSLVLTGCTTSGCVRATAVDAFSLNYRVVVPEECVYDRSSVSHAVNLFDMASKYADVAPLSQVTAMLANLSPS